MNCAVFAENNGLYIVVLLSVFLSQILCQTPQSNCNDCQKSVQNGRCLNESGVCRVLCKHGYWGKSCQYGKLRLTEKRGFISDNEGEKDYAAVSKLMWLIEAKYSLNSSIHFKIEEFTTECNWDHLYIFDGDSIYAPQIAAFSGEFVDSRRNASAVPQDIVAKSGKAYIYFYSDISVQNIGFNISYSIVENCNCANDGRCGFHGSCVCNEGWTGNACQNPVVVDCSQCDNGVCNTTTGICQCHQGYTGRNCDQQTRSSFWTTAHQRQSDSLVPPQASHSSVVIGDSMYVYTGYTSDDNPLNNTQIAQYNFNEEKWQAVLGSEMVPRWGHKMVAYKDTLIAFGGERNNSIIEGGELAIFNLTSNKWSHPAVSGDKPVGVIGHTTVIIGDKVLNIFGLGKATIYPYIQLYDIGQSRWEIIKTSVNFSFVFPRFGHSAVVEKSSGLVYIYGGLIFVRGKQTKVSPTDSLIAFSLTTRRWSHFQSSGFRLVFHTAVILDGMMLIYGGNPYVSKDIQPRCHTSRLLSYDFACRQWNSTALPQLPQRLARYGHTAVVRERAMYIFGGFNGALFNEILTYTHGNCSLFSNKQDCLKNYYSSGCAWDNGVCYNKGNQGNLFCPFTPSNPCALYKTCDQCTNSKIVNCGWSKTNKCVFPALFPDSKSCGVVSDRCRLFHDCMSCSDAKCIWKIDKCEDPGIGGVPTSVCATSCSDRPNSTLCLEEGVTCIWCEHVQRCVDDKLYIAYYPYGQCLEWTTKTSLTTGVSCLQRRTCRECHQLPGCGWCEGPQQNGLGVCLEGSDSGDMENKNCSRWNFISCPSCQCNGHSSCMANHSSVCISCNNHTTGQECERCTQGYFGDPRNGGVCKRCFCNGHTDEPCDVENGQCKCNMKGAMGKRCEQCSYPSYEGNATNGGHCYYKLAQSYIYKINVSDKSIFNFVCTLSKTDRDTEIKVDVTRKNKTFHAKLNISVESDLEKERFVAVNYLLNTEYSNTFSKDNFDFGHNNFKFNVYIFDITPQSVVTVSVHQPSDNSIDLLQFFIIFLACFIGLLVLAIIFWKAKTSFDAFRVSRRRNVELVYMTNRPFASVPICIERPENLLMKTKPAPLTSEICYGNKAGVVTVLIRMPVCAQTEGSCTTEVLCLGSALVNFTENPGSKMLSYVKNVKRRQNPFRSTPRS